MAFTGSIQNKRPGAGVYPGAGIARGGTQGRMNTMHGGIGARSGGYTPGATGKRRITTGARQPFTPAGPATHTTPNATRPTSGYVWVVKNGERVRVHRDTLTPDVLKRALQMQMNGGAGFGTKPVADPAQDPAAGLPGYKPVFELHDSTYFNDLAGYQRQLDDDLNPLQGELARIQYRGVGGKTLYERMYERAQSDFTRGLRDTRGEAARSGLLRSGRFDRQAGEMSNSWVDQQAQLDNELGAGAVNRLQTQQAQARARFAESQRLLELAAAERARERLAAYNAATYGQTIMPEEG
jgi:hypothetical protein